MNVAFTPEQQLLFDTALGFARTSLSLAEIRQLEMTENGFDLDVWHKMVALGWSDLCLLGEEADRLGGIVEMALIVEACARAALPSPMFSTIIEAGWLLARNGSPHQREQWLKHAMNGNCVLTTAVLERDGELLTRPIETTLEQEHSTCIVRGKKLFVRDAALAKCLICLARSGPRAHETSWVLIPSATPGVRTKRMLASGGEPLFEVEFDSVEVGSDAIVGERGTAQASLRELMLRGACLKAAELLGLGHAALELTINYAKQRTQFARPIGSFQAVQHHCADMYLDWQATRLLVYQAAAALDRQSAPVREVAMAKAKASEAIPALTRLAHQIHGSLGYYRDYPLEIYYHRALAAQVAYGDAFFHRKLLADLLKQSPLRFRGDNAHELPIHSL